MHGPAVASLLAGKTIGVAPDAHIYYAAWPSWLEDSRYAADALDWVLEQNEALPEGKIRVGLCFRLRPVPPICSRTPTSGTPQPPVPKKPGFWF